MSSGNNYEKLGDESITQEESNGERIKKAPPNNSILGKIKQKLSIFKADGFKIIVGGCIVFSTALTIALIVDIYTKEPPKGHGAVSSDSPICSQMGTDVLTDRGSAVDAAVVVALCLSVVQVGSTGLASGGYLLSHAPNGIDETFDFQYTAPASASTDMFKGKKGSADKGGLSFAIPGFVKGLKKAHKGFGYKPWKSLVEKVIPLAENGFQIDSFTAQKISDRITEFSPELKNLLAPKGVPLKTGETLKLPKLAVVLRNIADNGPEGFYSGTVAEEIVKTVNAAGGNITLADLKNYKPVNRKPIIIKVGEYKIMSAASPSSGPIVLLALNILDELKIKTNEKFLVKSFHYMAEAFKFAFAQRTLLGDPSFISSDITSDIIKKSFAKDIAKRVKPNETFAPSYYGPQFAQPKTKGTSDFVVLGTNGDMVSCVSTLGSAFGSKYVTESGIVLNNGMGSFSSSGFANIYDVEPSEANKIKPGKRPLSAASPVLAFDSKKPCKTHTILSSGDGVKAITSIIQAIWSIVKYEDDVTTAVQFPRLHHQLEPNVLRAEGSKFRKASMSNILKGLAQIGHKLDDSPKKLGTVHAAARTDSVISAHADSRSGGGSVAF